MEPREVANEDEFKELGHGWSLNPLPEKPPKKEETGAEVLAKRLDHLEDRVTALEGRKPAKNDSAKDR
jgi:hypothetical protein